MLCLCRKGPLQDREIDNGSQYAAPDPKICYTVPMGLLIVYTGNGKGKTTAALGQTFRALGHGWKICFLQFIKGDRDTGEARFAAGFPDLLDFRTLGRGFVGRGERREQDREAALAAWDRAREAVDSGLYRLVVLDELPYLFKYGFLDPVEAVRVLEGRPETVHVVVTGRGAPAELIEAADLVTDMSEIKHPLKRGIRSQEGIEF